MATCARQNCNRPVRTRGYCESDYRKRVRMGIYRYRDASNAREHVTQLRQLGWTRCWWNPNAKGCKTCEHYYPGDNGCEGDPGCNCASPEFCYVGVILPAEGLMIRCEKWEPIDG